jgi:hypothetical protein
MQYVLVKERGQDRATLSGALLLINRTGAALDRAKVEVTDGVAALSAFGLSSMANSKVPR